MCRRGPWRRRLVLPVAQQPALRHRGSSPPPPRGHSAQLESGAARPLTPARAHAALPRLPAARFGLSCRPLDPLVELPSGEQSFAPGGSAFGVVPAPEQDRSGAAGRLAEQLSRQSSWQEEETPRSPISSAASGGSGSSGSSGATSLSLGSSIASGPGSVSGTDAASLKRISESSSGESGDGGDASGRLPGGRARGRGDAGGRQVLHRPSPMPLPAVLEAKAQRKQSRMKFDSRAMEADSDGEGGQDWYQQQLREQLQRDQEREEEDKARPRPPGKRSFSFRDAIKAASSDTFAEKNNMRA